MNRVHDRLRPSMLPKLAKCGHYRSAGDPGPAAARGRRMDTAFRALIAGRNASCLELDPEDRQAIRWAVETARALSKGYALESREQFLRTTALGLTGTADLLCGGASWSADLKTGQRHSYVEQQAAYALGFMQDHFTDEWTVYLFYCDLREVDTLKFTLASATELIRAALNTAQGHLPPSINEYCRWCADCATCPARKAPSCLTPADAATAELASPALWIGSTSEKPFPP